mmetsp:Transcript_57447/g.64257  ORF Transcript_57447/g.64257 Transcript_57447/m.64257 type:complete len:249 (-) Transcript_57447:53-799(-)
MNVSSYMQRSSRKNAVRERMKKKLRQEQEAARQKEKETQNAQIQLAQELIPTHDERNQMDYTERNKTVIQMLDNRDKLPKRTQVRIDKFVEDFFTITSEHGMEFTEDGKVNHELSTYEETDDFKDQKVAAKATADRKAIVAALLPTEATARTEARATTAAISIAATKAAKATAAAAAATTEAARRQQVEAAVAAALLATETTTEVVTAVSPAPVPAPAPAVPKTKEQIAALQKATDYIHDYLVKGHYY